MSTITPRDRATLRGLGNTLKPLLAIGKEGLTDAVVSQLDGLLLQHELVKIKVLKTAEDDRHDLAEALSKKAGAELVQVIGRTMLLYRRHPKKPKLLVESAEGK
jgi:RNA-binding protein